MPTFETDCQLAVTHLVMPNEDVDWLIAEIEAGRRADAWSAHMAIADTVALVKARGVGPGSTTIRLCGHPDTGDQIHDCCRTCAGCERLTVPSVAPPNTRWNGSRWERNRCGHEHANRGSQSPACRET